MSLDLTTLYSEDQLYVLTNFINRIEYDSSVRIDRVEDCSLLSDITQSRVDLFRNITHQSVKHCD